MTDIEAALVAEGKYKQGLPEVESRVTDEELIKACRIGRYSFEPKEAADAIERLIAERDEALEALRNLIIVIDLPPNHGELIQQVELARDVVSKYEVKP